MIQISSIQHETESQTGENMKILIGILNRRWWLVIVLLGVLQPATPCIAQAVRLDKPENTAVIIVGQRPGCGIGYENDCGFPDPGRNDGGGGGFGGGGAGGGGAATQDKNDAINRQPECLREQLFVDELLAEIASQGAPIGQSIMYHFKDPLYQQGWIKYEAAQITTHLDVPNNLRTRWAIYVHYMYAPSTQAVAQVKLKNTYTSGCQGVLSGIK